MPRNSGTGTYTRDGGSYQGTDIYEQEFVAGDFINYQSHDAEHNDIAAEITDSLSRSGKGAALANLSMGGFKLQDVGTPTDPNDAANKDFAESVINPGNVTTVTPTIYGDTTELTSGVTASLSYFALGKMVFATVSTTGNGSLFYNLNIDLPLTPAGMPIVGYCHNRETHPDDLRYEIGGLTYPTQLRIYSYYSGPGAYFPDWDLEFSFFYRSA